MPSRSVGLPRTSSVYATWGPVGRVPHETLSSHLKVPERATINTADMSNTTTTDIQPTLTETGAGDHLHFLNHLATVKSAHDRTVSGMNAIEFTAPRGFGPPLHLHHEEDEIMYLVDGTMRLVVDGEEREATAGAVVALPAGVAHTFQVTSAEATFLTVAGGRRDAATFDVFVAALGQPTATAALPDPIEIDPGHVAAIAAAHGIEILGPPPAPLD